MPHRRKWFILWIFIPIFVIVAFLLISVYLLLDPNLYRNIIQKSLTNALEREVSIGKAKIYLWGGVGIAFEDFRVKDRSQAFDLLQSKRLVLRLRLSPLLRKEIQWRQIIVDRPIFHLVRDKNGQLNMFINGSLAAEKLKEAQKRVLGAITSLFGGSLAIREGEILFSDERFGDPPLKTEIRSFNMELLEVAYLKAFPFKIQGRMIHSNQEGFFSIHGTIQNIQKDLDFSKGGVEAEVKMPMVQG